MKGRVRPWPLQNHALPYLRRHRLAWCGAIVIMLSGVLNGAEGTAYHREFSDGWVHMSIDVAQSRLRVAQPTQLRIQIDAPLGTQIVFPSWDAAEELPLAWGNAEVVAIDRWDALPSDASPEQRRWIRRLEIESLRAGTAMLPAIEVRYQLADESRAPATIVSEPIELEIESTLPPTADPREFRDIKGEVALDAAEGYGPSPLGLAAVLAAALVGTGWGIGWYRYRRWRQVDRWALREIATIRRQASLGSDVDSQSSLLRVLREYLSERYDFDARSLSNEELLALIRQRSELNQTHLQPLVDFLKASQLARFAGRNTADAAELGCEAISEFILATRQTRSRHASAPEPAREVASV